VPKIAAVAYTVHEILLCSLPPCHKLRHNLEPYTVLFYTPFCTTINFIHKTCNGSTHPKKENSKTLLRIVAGGVQNGKSTWNNSHALDDSDHEEYRLLDLISCSMDITQYFRWTDVYFSGCEYAKPAGGENKITDYIYLLLILQFTYKAAGSYTF
jgi:hypothetical protein